MVQKHRRELIGNLVRLRPMTMGDVPKFFETSRDWDVAKMTGSFPWPFTLAVARARVARAVSADPSRGQEFGIIVKGQLAGSISIRKIELPNISGNCHFTLGYHIDKSWWGEGFASDAVRTLLPWAHARFGPSMVIEAGHYTDNPASGRVLMKNGFVLTGDIKKVYCCSRTQWLASVEYEWVFPKENS